METSWQYFPRFAPAPEHLKKTVAAFEKVEEHIATPKHQLSSNEVLEFVADNLEALRYKVERGKTKAEKIYRPVLYGKDGSVDKAFEVVTTFMDTLYSSGRLEVPLKGILVIGY